MTKLETMTTRAPQVLLLSAIFWLGAACMALATQYGPIAGKAYGKGTQALVIIAHGGSSALAIRNAIRVAVESVDHKVNAHITATLAALEDN